MMSTDKAAVRDFWSAASCGEELYLTDVSSLGYASQAAKRYELEPYILEFAELSSLAGLNGLEIGIGLGADFENQIRAGAKMTGIDLTLRAVEHVSTRLREASLEASVTVGDAENLGFPDRTFDFVYSWGVLHHSPNTPRAVAEVLRVLKPGGVARIMIYNKYSMVGLMLWLRYGFLRLGRPLSLAEVYAKYLESPGTKAYTPAQARQLFGGFAQVNVKTILTHGDLLASDAGQRHRGVLLSIARVLWPRWFIKRVLPRAGLFMLIRAVKPL